jgi:conjugative transposon TraK protein
MFQQFKNIDTAFRQIRLFAMVFVTACTLITVYISCRSYELAAKASRRIYILAGGKALEAFSAEQKENIPVEARDHVKMFHFYFFSLDPDDKVIQSNINKALYLADQTAKQQYDNLRENGYYANIISGNISQEIEVDSVTINTEVYPYLFRYTGRQRIIRPASVTIRKLVTEGCLRAVSRSDNNPHGFLIEKWKTIENTDLSTQNR